MAYFFKRADPQTNKNTKNHTINGQPIRLVAIQDSRRTYRKGRVKYVYQMGDGNLMYWNRSRNGVMFFPMARLTTNMQRYYEIFVGGALTDKEAAWLERNDYVLVKPGSDL